MNASDWKKILLVGVVGALPAIANATSITSLLDLIQPGRPSLGSGPLGIVTLTQNGANEVDVNVSLDASVGFYSTPVGPEHAFVFNLDLLSPFVVTIISPTDQFNLTGAGQSNDPYGEFTYTIDCNCGPSESIVVPGPLNFEVTDSSGVSLSDFVANAGGFFFSAHVVRLSRDGRGNIASNSVAVVTVPEPATLLLIGIGFVGFSLCVRPRSVVSPLS
jgi:hypothetical protein